MLNSWEITLPIAIVIIFGLGIGGYALVNESNFYYRFYGELKGWLKIETEVKKCCQPDSESQDN